MIFIRDLPRRKGRGGINFGGTDEINYLGIPPFEGHRD